MPAAWPSIFGSKNTQPKEDSAELVNSDQQHHPNAYQERDVNELGEQNPDGPMSMGDMQDVMYFKFVMGRPILNFILAILWSIGLPILLYHLLRPRIGQIAGMIVASLPPLAIVVWRMWRTRTPDPLGFVMGVSFFISGLLSIAQPDERWQLLGDSITPLLVGMFCLVSLLPFQYGRHHLRPLTFQIAQQVMPRDGYGEEEPTQNERQTFPEYDNQTPHHKSKKAKLMYLYHNVPSFRRDMRVLTAVWGVTLMLNFVVKICLITSPATTDQVRNWGYAELGVVTLATAIFSYVYTRLVSMKGIQEFLSRRTGISSEAIGRSGNFAETTNRNAQGFSNVYGQVMG
ncbi:hypothetical protein INT44_008824 [Umbelopsis vinacea]|uniref:Uncharacterized protein n=1 Tax=Umbelopsis vinacea TaxID=44442 RepID=A0A8H7Q0T2_9FUNG|nr:hypothetical protein INT44_008824 [Umbelopsis vinacea]